MKLTKIKLLVFKRELQFNVYLTANRIHVLVLYTVQNKKINMKHMPI